MSSSRPIGQPCTGERDTRDIIITRYATLIGCILDSTKPEVLLHGRARRRFGGVHFPSSHTRLASPEVVDRGLAESVSKPSIGVGTFKKDFFCLTQV